MTRALTTLCLLGLFAFASCANPNSSCSSRIYSTMDVLALMNADILTGQMDMVKDDFADLEYMVREIDSACATVFTPPTIFITPSMVCLDVVSDAADKLAAFNALDSISEENIIVVVGYLHTLTPAFSYLCHQVDLNFNLRVPVVEAPVEVPVVEAPVEVPVVEAPVEVPTPVETPIVYIPTVADIPAEPVIEEPKVTVEEVPVSVPETIETPVADDSDDVDTMAGLAYEIKELIENQGQPIEQPEKTEVAAVEEEDKTEEDPRALTNLVNRIFAAAQTAPAQPAVEETVAEPVAAPTANVPSPECLSNVYLTLSTLYQFAGDAFSQDIDSVKSDYSSLVSVTQTLNNYCDPKVDITPAYFIENATCDTAMQDIVNILDKFQNSDPNDYLNVLNAVQGLWNSNAAFAANC